MNPLKKEKILLQKETKFNAVTVIRLGNIITLWSGINKQTEIQVARSIRPCLEYSQNCFLALAFQPEPRSILVLGLGGGVMPTLFHEMFEKAVIDVVEIDPEMREIAQTYFQFKMSERLRVFIDDAFFFVRDTTNTYDIIIMDAYIGNQLPETVDTMAFVAEIARILTPKGVFVSNLMSANKTQFNNILERMNRLFKRIWLLPGILSTNTVVFASRQELPDSEIQKQARSLPHKLPFDFKTGYLVSRLELYSKSTA